MNSYRLLIIDDEEPVREAVRLLGLWNELEVGQIFEAENGRQALELLATQAIDLVLVDMKMPEMDGQELLKIMEQQYPDILSIVISGYQDFDYTRQAIRSRVVDYLLKPINRHDLNLSLKKAIDILQAKKDKEKESIHRNITLNMSLPKLKEKLYVSILDRTFKSYYNEELIRLIGVHDPGQTFIVSAMRLFNLDEVIAKRFKDDYDLLYFAISNVIYEVTSAYECFSFANPKQEREVISVFSIKQREADDVEFHLYHLMNKIVGTLNRLFQLDTAIGIGCPVREITGLADSYEQAKRALSSLNLHKRSAAVIPFKESMHNPIAYKTILPRHAHLKQALESGNRRLLHSNIREAAKLWADDELFTLDEADRLLDDLVTVLNDLAIELSVPAEQLPIGSETPLRTMGVSGDFRAYEQFEQRLYELADRYYDLVKQARQQTTSFKIADIKFYIDQNYFEDIKVSMFAEKYYLSREYLMKLFKQEYGFGIHEYVQKVRMEKARELLKEPNLKIQDISEMLGYKDKNYFSKAFRNYFSCSPTEYRSNLEPAAE